MLALSGGPVQAQRPSTKSCALSGLSGEGAGLSVVIGSGLELDPHGELDRTWEIRFLCPTETGVR
jgi:hypothetical protein